MYDTQMELDIQELNLTAPRVTPDIIDSLMSQINYHTYVIPDTTCTVASAVLDNGFVLAIDYTACASPENFNEELGRKYSIEKVKLKAKDNLWLLEGYFLKKLLTDPIK